MDQKSIIEQHINNWVSHLSINRKELDNSQICPFAKNSKFKIIETTIEDIKIVDEDFELIIYKFSDLITEILLLNTCQILNKKYPNLIFLPDHKDRKTYINNIITNNGKYNLILCQSRIDLNIARLKLRKTNYYSFWDQHYLQEILTS